MANGIQYRQMQSYAYGEQQQKLQVLCKAGLMTSKD